MAVRSTAASAAAVLAAAVAVYALVCRERRIRRLKRVLSRERASNRLVSGCLVRDLEEFRRRLVPLLAEQAVVAAAALVVAESLSVSDPMSPPMEGGPR